MVRVWFASLLGMTILFAASARLACAETRPVPIVAAGELRREIKATPILERPNRPLHFYGNTVRRQYYRGASIPAARQ